MFKHRSAASLLLSGMATITLDQRLRLPKLPSAQKAWDADQKALASDGRRVMRGLAARFGRA